MLKLFLNSRPICVYFFIQNFKVAFTLRCITRHKMVVYLLKKNIFINETTPLRRRVIRPVWTYLKAAIDVIQTSSHYMVRSEKLPFIKWNYFLPLQFLLKRDNFQIAQN